MTEIATVGTFSVIQALNAVMKDVTSVGKDERNTQQGWSFRGIDATLDAVGPAFRRHGVVAMPQVLSFTHEVLEMGSKRTPMGHVIVHAIYRFYGPAGDSAEATVIGEAADAGDKACAKAMSVAFRTALLQVLSIPTGEPDPDSFSYERSGPDSPAAQASRSTARRTAEQAREPAWGETIARVVDVDGLRAIWKNAGAAGALQTEVTSPDGEKATVERLLMARHDELELAKSASGATSGAGGDYGA